MMCFDTHFWSRRAQAGCRWLGAAAIVLAAHVGGAALAFCTGRRRTLEEVAAPFP